MSHPSLNSSMVKLLERDNENASSKCFNWQWLLVGKMYRCMLVKQPLRKVHLGLTKLLPAFPACWWYNLGQLTMNSGLENPQALLSLGKKTRHACTLDEERVTSRRSNISIESWSKNPFPESFIRATKKAISNMIRFKCSERVFRQRLRLKEKQEQQGRRKEGWMRRFLAWHHPHSLHQDHHWPTQDQISYRNEHWECQMLFAMGPSKLSNPQAAYF